MTEADTAALTGAGPRSQRGLESPGAEVGRCSLKDEGDRQGDKHGPLSTWGPWWWFLFWFGFISASLLSSALIRRSSLLRARAPDPCVCVCRQTEVFLVLLLLLLLTCLCLWDIWIRCSSHCCVRHIHTHTCTAGVLLCFAWEAGEGKATVAELLLLRAG